jgi:membrane protein implicated in regulation of membrane protease activity
MVIEGEIKLNRPSTYTIANIGSLIAVFIGVLNLVTLREVWILVAAMAVLVILSIYAVREKRKIQKQRQQ